MTHIPAAGSGVADDGKPFASPIANAISSGLADRYRLEREIGRGGMAAVFLATDLKHDRPVALKVLRPELAHAVGIERFQREIRLAARLQHPHILTVHDSGETEGHLWFTMPFVDGETLRDRLRREGRLSVDEALRVAGEAAQALAHAHAHGVVHRDVKPENLLITREGQTLVADFGIARPLATSTEPLTTTGVGLGTPLYMSPEQAMGERTLDERTDVYSLGAVLYELLVGAPPYTGPTPQAILAQQIGQTAPSVRRVRGDVPEAVDTAVRRALAPNPDDRFPSMLALADALGVRSVSSSHDSGARTSGALRRRPTNRAVLLGAAGLLTAVAVGSWAMRARSAAPVTAAADHVAVLPFAVHGGKGVDYLGQGVVDLLGRNLDGAGGLHSVNGATVLTATAATNAATIDVKSGRQIARRLGAGLFVLGTVSDVGGQVRIDAQLYDGAPAEPKLVAQSSQTGDSAHVFALLDRVTADLAVGRRDGAGPQLLRSSTEATASLPALKAFLEGERYLRQPQYDSAFRAFDRAVNADTSFALAWYRRALMANEIGRADAATESMAHAKRLINRLSERDRRFVRGFDALLDGRAEDAEREYRSVLVDDHDDLEAEWRLAELLFTYNPLRGRPIDDALPLFERVHSADVTFGCTVCALRLLRLHVGRAAQAESLVRKQMRYADSAMFAAVHGDRTTLAHLAAESSDTARTNVEAVATAAWLVGQWVQQPDAAEPFARAAVARPDRSNRSYITLVKNLMGQGRWIAADSVLVGRYDGTNTVWARGARALNSTIPFLEAPRASLEQRRAELLVDDARPQPGTMNGMDVTVATALRRYSIGLLSSRLGDTVRARTAATWLEDSTGMLPGRAGRALGAAVRADVALEAGRPAEALKLLEPVRGDVPLGLTGSNPFTEDYARYLRVEALLALGRDNEALPWLLNGFEFAESEIFLRPWIAKRLAEIYDKRGNQRQAAQEYERFIRLWNRCDERLRPQVEEARKRLAALSG